MAYRRPLSPFEKEVQYLDDQVTSWIQERKKVESTIDGDFNWLTNTFGYILSFYTAVFYVLGRGDLPCPMVYFVWILGIIVVIALGLCFCEFQKRMTPMLSEGEKLKDKRITIVMNFENVADLLQVTKRVNVELNDAGWIQLHMEDWIRLVEKYSTNRPGDPQNAWITDLIWNHTLKKVQEGLQDSRVDN